MKTYFNFTLVLAMLLFVGCSVEPLEDSSLDERQLTTETTKTQAFVIQGYGDLLLTPAHIVDNPECKDLTLIETQGWSTEATLGHFTTSTRICTDRVGYYKVRGVHSFPSGEELYFESIDYVDHAGEMQMLLMFNGGTGIFMNATGTVDMNETTDYHSVREGTYVNAGEGILMIGRGI